LAKNVNIRTHENIRQREEVVVPAYTRKPRKVRCKRWTTNDIALLRKMWMEGVKASMIGRKMHRTEKAIILMARKDKLPKRSERKSYIERTPVTKRSFLPNGIVLRTEEELTTQ
jgi:hypothetical protein